MEVKIQLVLEKVLLLAKQNKEFNQVLRDKLLEKKTTTQTIDEFSSVVSLQHKKCRGRARKYYKEIKNTELRNTLISYYAKMLWYKSTFDIGCYFVNVNLQIECMLNYYLEQTDFHNKVTLDPNKYCHTLHFPKTEYKMDINIYNYAFVDSKKSIGIPKIKSLWVKLLYWAIDTDNVDFLEKHVQEFSYIINIRNENEHAIYDSEKKSTLYWENREDELGLAFIEATVKVIRNSIINI